MLRKCQSHRDTRFDIILLILASFSIHTKLDNAAARTRWSLCCSFDQKASPASRGLPLDRLNLLRYQHSDKNFLFWAWLVSVLHRIPNGLGYTLPEPFQARNGQVQLSYCFHDRIH